MSPVYAHLAGLPPVLVVAGGLELLRDDAVKLVDRAMAAGVAARIHLEPDMVHAFPALSPGSEAARRSLDLVASFVDQGRPPSGSKQMP